MAQKKTQGGSSTSTNPKLDPNPPTNTEKQPDEWVSGDDPMTGAQASYLKTLSEEAGDPDAGVGFGIGKEADMAGKRELIDTGTDKRYVRRDKKGQFKESDDVTRSLAQDVRRKAKTVVKAGYGDKGDQKRK